MDEIYKPEGDDQELINWAQEKFDSYIKSRWEIEKSWYVNTAFFLGKQYQVFDEVTRSFREENVPSWRVRMVSNQVYIIVKTKIAQILKAKPIFRVIPATGESKDVSAAKIGDRLLMHLWRSMDMDTVVHEMAAWMFTCGSGFLKYYWDSSLGKYVGSKDGRALYEGDIRVEAISPFEVGVDPHVTRLEDASWVQQYKRRSLDYIFQQYPNGKYVKAQGQETSGELYLQKIQNVSPVTTGIINQEKYNEDSAVVVETWQKPNKKYPKGKHTITCNGVLLFSEDMITESNPWCEFPLVKFDETIMPGRFWGISSVEQVVPLQKEYNRSISQIIEAKNLCTKPKVLNPKGSGVAKSSFTTEPGEFIEYKAGLAPQYMQLPQLPQFVFENLNRTMRDIQQISFVNDISRGSQVSGARSGEMLQIYAEEDQSKIATTIQLFERGMSILGQRLLRMAQLKYREKRTIKIVGQNNEWQFWTFQGSDLSSNFDVKVTVTSSLDQNLSARRQLLMQLVQYQMINPQQVPLGKLMKMMEVGAVEALFDVETKDANTAEYENMIMAKGQTAKVEYFQDHDTHIACHDDFRKDMEFQKLPESVQAYFEFHVNQHREAKQAQMMFEQQQAMAMQPPQGEGQPEEPEEEEEQQEQPPEGMI